MNIVYLLWHSHPTGGGELNEKLIGVYDTKEDATAAMNRVLIKPGFRDYPEGFEIVPKVMGEDHWEEGYFTE